MERFCRYVPRQGVNKGIMCNKYIVKTEFCSNHRIAGRNRKFKHECEYIDENGKKCNNLIRSNKKICWKHYVRKEIRKKKDKNTIIEIAEENKKKEDDISLIIIFD